jgi:hypothetical protein
VSLLPIAQAMILEEENPDNALKWLSLRSSRKYALCKSSTGILLHLCIIKHEHILTIKIKYEL